ncbi:MAG TPA: hypothetical protein VL202_00390 [Pararhizobium sp.]|uniref:hypothetical protein n=1 Tax=Pararhizobium sp. TaxID=1977563 RepID=UPI002D0A1CED|nr:hypothetical protein [Pararhizobium sp.]HTO29628.1 hypothetical protein [Pararhizobium sp.]
MIDDLLMLSDAFCSATGLAETTLSSKIFNDGKRIAAVRSGKDVGVRRLERGIIWLSENWPTGAEWPAEVVRPVSVSMGADDDRLAELVALVSEAAE